MLSSVKENKSASVSADGTQNIPPSAIPKRWQQHLWKLLEFVST